MQIKKDRPEAQIVKRTKGAITIETKCENEAHYNALKDIRTLRISGLGKVRCDKERLLEIFGYKPEIPIEVQNILDAGTVLEGLIIKQLKQKGWNVDWNNAEENKENLGGGTKRYIFPLSGGVATGTPDAIAVHPEKTKGIQVLCDAKTMNDNRFTGWLQGSMLRVDPVGEKQKRDWWYPTVPKEILKSHTARCFPEYFFQVSAYALASGLEYGMIAGYNKNNSKTDVELFKVSPSLVNNILFRAQIALTATNLDSICGYTGNCENCWHKITCGRVFGRDGIAELQEQFHKHPPLRKEYSPLTVLAAAYDLSDETGEKIPAPSQKDLDAQFANDISQVSHIFVKPEIRTLYEKEESSVALENLPKYYIGSEDLDQWKALRGPGAIENKSSGVNLRDIEKFELSL